MIRLIRNFFWLLLGLALGMWVMRRLNQIARSYSPSGIAGRAQDHWGGFRDGMIAFGRDVRARADAREVELRAALAGENPTPLPGAPRHRARPFAGPAAPGTDPDARPFNRHGD